MQSGLKGTVSKVLLTTSPLRANESAFDASVNQPAIVLFYSKLLSTSLNLYGGSTFYQHKLQTHLSLSNQMSAVSW